ncbi:proline-rich transmembrane protein 1-like [Mercenaria mercenaria]|uniref:proline-rich transmembrane protein 1-like n=1 Tax=Mercenaria mercenaria TaxID=6596 RepID=UPI001E1DA8CF|nr:proline-rich transmembrane protein 1-like [Mercenaria mercenaria]
MAERAGYDQPGDFYTDKNTSYGEDAPPPYQPGPKQTGYPSQQPGNVEQPYISASTTLLVNQPQAETVIIKPRPPDRMVDSILVFLCCFWPTGIYAIYYANKANRLARAGDYEGARWMSDTARKFIILSMFVGFTLIIFGTFYARQHYIKNN